MPEKSKKRLFLTVCNVLLCAAAEHGDSVCFGDSVCLCGLLGVGFSESSHAEVPTRRHYEPLVRL